MVVRRKGPKDLKWSGSIREIDIHIFLCPHMQYEIKGG